MPSNQIRVQAIQDITRKTLQPPTTPQSLESLWAADVFTLAKMKEHLPKEVFKSLKKTIETGGPLDLSVADVVAQAMKEWAIAKGALYYAHVFYPLTNATAEKHDGFISVQRGPVISEFTGKLLVQGEPDGSSFPNGGIRGTSEARGYTAWDVTSPAYIIENTNGSTLCIPTVFVSWTGEALDKKTPLLRSIAAMNKAAKRVLTVLGHKDIATVNSSCGAEQEYFLIDAAFAAARPDLLLAGRTLFGKPPPRPSSSTTTTSAPSPSASRSSCRKSKSGCTSSASRPRRATTRWRPASSRSLPSSSLPTSPSDHQQLTMTILKNTAKRHGLVCLLHEKPFAGVNGSGKHVNWSVGNATQGNLLDPGDTPHDNTQFLVFCGAVIRMVHKYGPLLRAVIATASNDHRLGANEAPPAIMSVYLGSQLEDVFKQIQRGALTGSKSKGIMNLGVDIAARVHQGPRRPQPHLALCLHRQPLRVPRGRREPVGLRTARRDEHHAGRLPQLDGRQARSLRRLRHPLERRRAVAAQGRSWMSTAQSCSAATATRPSGTRWRWRSAACSTSPPAPRRCPCSRRSTSRSCSRSSAS